MDSNEHRPGDREADELAILAHQLRSPLGGIRFAADMLLHGDYGPLSETAKKPVALILESATRILNTLEASLNAARVDSASVHLQCEKIDIAHELETLMAEMRPQAEAKQLELVLETKDLPAALLFDGEALRAIVSNVVENAIKYTDAGMVKVGVSYEGQQLHLIVQDTGIGIRPEERGRLFQRFYRGQNGKDRPGVGLGLFIVKQYADKLGGAISVQSEGKGRGSTFIVDLPAMPHL